MANLILINAEKLREMHTKIHEAFNIKAHGPEHEAAAKAFHEAYDSLAFPGGLSQALEKLKNHDPSIIDEIIFFLKENPDYFRSGYHKEEMLRRLKSFVFNKSQESLLASLIIRSIDEGPGRLFSAYARLSRKIDYNLLSVEIKKRLKSNKPEIQRRALHIHDLYLENKSRKI